jgi:cyclopropane-fatty-acyl-phospholipid synthase
MTAASVLEPVLRELDPRQGRDRPFALRFWDGSELPAPGTPAFTLHARRREALGHLLRRPDQLGAARAWVSGALDVEGDLQTTLRVLGERLDGFRLTRRNYIRLARAGAELGALRPPPIPAGETRPRGRRHSLRRDARAISHHYDVPTGFYRLVLGPSLVYSCAYFERPGDSLERAQEAKLDLICRKLRLTEGERFLDVGCGWGSLVIHAARRYGARATGVTLSREQAAEAERRIAAAGLSDRAEVRLCDYRELRDGPYDKIASVGMYEHVGRDELAGYVDRLGALLRAGGLLLNHGITRLRPVEGPRRSFVDAYVFPDGELHPVGAILGLLEERGWELRHVEALREHYVRTLRAWAANLAAHRAEAIALAGEERERVWRLYMTACALAFERGDIGVYQTLAVRPGAAAELMPRRAPTRPRAARPPRRRSPYRAPRPTRAPSGTRDRR